jgi:hypothetical protein
MKKTFRALPLLALSASAFVAANCSAAQTYYHRRPAQVTCPTNGCSAVAERVLPGLRTPPPTLTRSLVALSAFPKFIVPAEQDARFQISHTILLKNTGTEPVSPYSIEFKSGEYFFHDWASCYVEIGPGQTCELNIMFATRTFGNVSDVLRVRSDAENSPVEVSLNGEGIVQERMAAAVFGAFVEGKQSESQMQVVVDESGVTDFSYPHNSNDTVYLYFWFDQRGNVPITPGAVTLTSSRPGDEVTWVWDNCQDAQIPATAYESCMVEATVKVSGPGAYTVTATLPYGAGKTATNTFRSTSQ